MGKLTEAVARKNVEAVQKLLTGEYQNSGLINEERNSNGYSALDIAAFYGYSILIKLLLKAGADPSFKIADQKSPLEIAGEKNDTESILLLTDSISQKTLNLQILAAFSPLVKTVLTSLSYVHAEGIPISWLQRVVFGECSLKTALELDKVLEALQNYSLIQLQPEQQTVRVYCLVQTITRQEQTYKESLQTLEKVIEALVRYYDSDNRKMTQNRRLIPHLLAALKQVEALFPPSSESTPVGTLLLILHKLAEAYIHVGDYVQAKGLLERALAIDEKHYGKDDPQTGMILVKLCDVYYFLGDHEKAKDLLTTCGSAIKEKYCSKTHPEMGKILRGFGNVWLFLGNADQAKAFYESAVEIDKNSYGLDHPQTRKNLINFGVVCNYLGNYQEAKNLLTIAIEFYGEDHPETGIILDNLAYAYYPLEHYQEAKDLLIRALAIKRKYYDPDHPSIGITLTNLSNACGSLGDYEKQVILLTHALTINEKYYGLDHPTTGVTLINLGKTSLSLGHPKKAKDFCTRGLAIFEKHCGQNHPSTGVASTYLGVALTYLADACSSLNDDTTAYVYQKRAYDTFFSSHGAEHFFTKRASQQLQKLKIINPPVIFSLYLNSPTLPLDLEPEPEPKSRPKKKRKII